MIANHGQSVQYVHDSIGVNSRLDNIQAAVLRIKLRHLDEYAAARNKAAAIYDRLLSGIDSIKTPERSSKSTHVFHQYTLQLTNINRNDLREFLAKKQIPAMVYYPIPLHLQKAYADTRYKAGDFPVTEHLCQTVLSLPMHTELTEESQVFIVEAIREYLTSQKNNS